MAVTLKILSLLQHLHLQIDLWEGICIACDILFKDHMCACQWSDTGPPGPLVLGLFGSRQKLLLANSGDPDQMPHYAASDLDLHCLPMYHF